MLLYKLFKENSNNQKQNIELYREKILFFGEFWTLKIIKEPKKDLINTNNIYYNIDKQFKTINIYLIEEKHSKYSSKNLDFIIDDFLKNLSRSLFEKLLKKTQEYYVDKLKLEGFKHMKGFKVKFLKSRLGSCSSLGNINLNIALLAYPLELMNYVVIHEFCHLKEMNHSRKFWELVALKDNNFRINRVKAKDFWLKVCKDKFWRKRILKS